MTIAATQKFNNGQYCHSIATRARQQLACRAGTRIIPAEQTVCWLRIHRNARSAHPSINQSTRPSVRACTRGPGTEAKAAFGSKIAGYRAAFESSGWTDPTVQRLVNVWEQQASRRLGPDRRWSPAGSSTRHVCSCPTRSNTRILELGFPSWGPVGVQVSVPG